MPRRARKRPAGQGTIWQQGGNWWIRWRENGRRRSAKFPTREIAERVLAKIVADMAAGRGGLEVERPPVPPLAGLATKWLERRAATHRSAYADRNRWQNHLAPRFGSARPDDLDPGVLRRFIEDKLASGLSSSTVRLLMRLLSTFYSDLVEQGFATRNPIKLLPRATRRLIRPAHDPRTTPFLERAEDIRRVFLALPSPIHVAFAIGALGGLRTGEVLALRWEHVDLERRRIHVRESIGGSLKDEESRIVPVQDALAPMLREWRLGTGGEGLVVPPMRGGSRKHCDDHTLGKKLRAALEALELPRLTWYQATRHTFASHWVLGGGTIEKLREILGHSTVLVTERYAHLRGDVFGPAELGRIGVDLTARGGKVIPLSTPGNDGHAVATASEIGEHQQPSTRRNHS